ncbi:MAG TPA: hypothetical protein VGM37_19925 [Armatimonadota bacterium]|jgi:hypothetical protein
MATEGRGGNWPVGEAGPVSDEELTRHLQAFAQSFISSARRQRWQPKRLTVPTRNRDQMGKFYTQCDPRYCLRISWEDAALRDIKARHGDARCVYLDENGLGIAISLCAGIDRALHDFTDAIISIIPGKLALMISHDGVRWLCSRP